MGVRWFKVYRVPGLGFRVRIDGNSLQLQIGIGGLVSAGLGLRCFSNTVQDCGFMIQE